MNFRPDYQSWIRMIHKWNKEPAAFYDASSGADPGVLTRLATDPEVKVIKMNATTEGRSTLMVKVKGKGKSKKARQRSSAKVLVDVFHQHGHPEANVFVKADSMKGLLRAVLKVQTYELDEEIAILLGHDEEGSVEVPDELGGEPSPSADDEPDEAE